MYKLLSVLLIVVLCMGCSNRPAKEISPTVTVSIVPQKFFVDQIAGDWLTVNVMIPPGGSPATYEPSPIQMKELSNSSLYFRIGHITFENAWMDKLSSIAPQLKIIDTSEGLDLISDEAFGSDHIDTDGENHHHAGYNPHIWLSPKLVKEQAKAICKALCEVYPQYTSDMKDNLARFSAQIDSVDLVMNQQLKNANGTSFIVYHPVWSYLAHDYGLKQIAIEHNGKEATANKIKSIIDFAHENDIHIIFVQKEFSNIQAKSIANEINGEVALMNPLDYNWFNTMKEFGEVFGRLQK